MALREALGNRSVRWITAGWTFFVAENVVLSENRSFLIDRFGDDAYHIAYSCLSTGACLSIALGCRKAYVSGSSPRIWNAGAPATRVLSTTLLSLGLVGFSQMVPKVQLPVQLVSPAAATPTATIAAGNTGLVGTLPANSPSLPHAPVNTAAEAPNHSAHGAANGGGSGGGFGKGFSFKPRCPMDFARSRSEQASRTAGDVVGLDRVTRHPSFYSLGLAGAGAALATSSAASAAFWAGPLCVSLVLTHHQDSRFRRGLGGTLSPAQDAATSNLPFVALLTGRQSWSKVYEEFKGTNALLACLLVALIKRRA